MKTRAFWPLRINNICAVTVSVGRKRRDIGRHQRLEALTARCGYRLRNRGSGQTPGYVGPDHVKPGREFPHFISGNRIMRWNPLVSRDSGIIK